MRHESVCQFVSCYPLICLTLTLSMNLINIIVASFLILYFFFLFASFLILYFFFFYTLPSWFSTYFLLYASFLILYLFFLYTLPLPNPKAFLSSRTALPTALSSLSTRTLPWNPHLIPPSIYVASTPACTNNLLKLTDDPPISPEVGMVHSPTLTLTLIVANHFLLINRSHWPSITHSQWTINYSLSINDSQSLTVTHCSFSFPLVLLKFSCSVGLAVVQLKNESTFSDTKTLRLR